MEDFTSAKTTSKQVLSLTLFPVTEWSCWDKLEKPRTDHSPLQLDQQWEMASLWPHS